MAEFDLIPSDYRSGLVRRRWLQLFLAALAAMVVLTGGAAAALEYVAREVVSEIDKLQAEQQSNREVAEKLGNLRKQKEQFFYQLSLLDGLRGGTPAERMFVAVDRALTDDTVWFQSWDFKRAGSSVKPAETPTTNTGYFIVVPKSNEAKTQQVWRIETHMTIKGKAGDHAALSRFIANLFAQPEIDDVKVLRTSMYRTAQMHAVDFDLAIVVNGGQRQ
ncbi:MAG: hypothetical protein OET44_20345 [Gammaproteobacteria bacterium]|nr:hypothetical protein [Gammaproteobacteria bacterium]